MEQLAVPASKPQVEEPARAGAAGSKRQLAVPRGTCSISIIRRLSACSSSYKYSHVILACSGLFNGWPQGSLLDLFLFLLAGDIFGCVLDAVRVSPQLLEHVHAAVCGVGTLSRWSWKIRQVTPRDFPLLRHHCVRPNLPRRGWQMSTPCA